MTELLNISVLVFAVASMLSVGFSHTVQEVLRPLRNVRAVIRLLLANFVLVPLLAWFVLRMVSLNQPPAIGLFLISTAAGAPFLIKLTETAGQNVGISATMLVLLLPVTILYMPVVVPLALPWAEVSALSIATPLVLSMLLPLAAGFIVRAWWPERALGLQPLMASLSSIALVVLVAATLIVNFEGITGLFGEGAILAVLLVIGGAFGLGYLMGGGNTESREEMALATAQRNIAAATVVATQTVGLAGTLNMVVLSSLVGLAVLFPVAFLMRKQAGAG